MTVYKTLTEEHRGPYSGFDFTEYLPGGEHAGEWLPEVDQLELCESGYHVTDAAHLLRWLDAEIWEVETSGESLAGDDKSVHQSVRFVRRLEAWNDKTARLFACWCVRQVWHLLTDERSKKAVEVAEKYANGEAGTDELNAAWTAARAAAWAAAWAAWTAARAAAWAAAWAAGDAARAAAWAAAWAAGDAGDAARAASWAAQTNHLFEILGEATK
jgi:hypothetical protein